MSYYLFLDDKRVPSDVIWANLPQNVHWEVAKNYQEFVRLIDTKGIPKFVAYDCDLCDEHYEAFFKLQHRYLIHYNEFKIKCGIHCLEYLLKVCQKQGKNHPHYECHTQNKYTRGFMENLIEAFNKGKSPTMPLPKYLNPPAYCTYDENTLAGFFGEHRYLSNFYPATVEYKGYRFGSTEAAFQGAKIGDDATLTRFAKMNPSESKKEGRKLVMDRKKWDEGQSFQVMYYLVFQKFSVHADLRAKLLSTGKKKLIEANNWRDNKWGQHYELDSSGVWKPSGQGMNKLGEILSTIRDVLQ